MSDLKYSSRNSYLQQTACRHWRSWFPRTVQSNERGGIPHGIFQNGTPKLTPIWYVADVKIEERRVLDTKELFGVIKPADLDTDKSENGKSDWAPVARDQLLVIRKSHPIWEQDERTTLDGNGSLRILKQYCKTLEVFLVLLLENREEKHRLRVRVRERSAVTGCKARS